MHKIGRKITKKNAYTQANTQKYHIFCQKVWKYLVMSKKSSTFAPQFRNELIISRSRAVVARQAHNLKVGGSIPPSATSPKEDVSAFWHTLFFFTVPLFPTHLPPICHLLPLEPHRNLIGTWLEPRRVIDLTSTCFLRLFITQKNHTPSGQNVKKRCTLSAQRFLIVRLFN